MNWFPSLKNPRGPNLNKLERFKLSLSGTVIEMALPKSNYPILPDEIDDTPFNLYASSLFKFHEDAICPLPILGCGIRNWHLKGLPFVHGDVARLEVHIFILRQEAFASLFSPSRAQKAIERFIYTFDGPAAKVYEFRCRNDWQVRQIGGEDWAGYNNTSPYFKKCYWHLPLTDEHMFVISFSYQRYYENLNLENYYHNFESTILNTIKVSRSLDAVGLKKECEAKYPDDRYSKILPPLIWDEEPVEDEMVAFKRILNEKMKSYSNIENADGTVDSAKDKKFDKEVEQAVFKLLSNQKEKLNEKINRTLASHLEFD